MGKLLTIRNVLTFASVSLLCALWGGSYAQKHIIDSLNQAYRTATHDTMKIKLAFDIAEILIRAKPDTCLILNKLALELAEARLEEQLSEDDKRQTKYWQGEALSNIGFILKRQGEIEQALDYYHRGLKVREDIGYMEGVAISLNNIALLYKSQGDMESVISYYKRSIEILEKEGAVDLLGDRYWNIGSAYRDMGDTVAYYKAFHKSADNYLKMDNNCGIGSYFFTKGALYNTKGDHDSSNYYFRQALPYYKKINHNHYLQRTFVRIAKNCFANADFERASIYADSSLQLAYELGYPQNISVSTDLLAQVYRRQNKWKGALEMYELHIKMRDSLKNEETQKATIRQQTKYEFEKAQLIKEQEEKEARRRESEVRSRRDNLQYSVILIAILVLFGGVLSLGFVKVSVRMAEGIIFFSFLILFEFMLVLADPHIEVWSGGAPGFKLLFNAGVAALIFPLHAFFESKMKRRITKTN